MDPTANLNELRRLYVAMLARANGKDWQDDDSDTYDQCEDGTRMAELVQALDEWLSKGGHAPIQWQGH